MTAPNRRQRNAYLDDIYARLLQDLGRSLSITAEQAERLIDEGPYTASQAVETPLVAATADEADLDDALAEIVDGRVRRRQNLRNSGPRSWGTGRRVGVVVVDGAIVDGENVDIPFVGIHQSGGKSVVEAIDRLARDRSVKAIVVRIDTGGGSSLASDQIWRAIRRARAKKPVIASLGEVAASGGYYIASACDEIFADPSTMTGSIGIFFGKVDFAILADRIGVHPEQLGRGAHAGAASLFRPFTDEEREMLQRQIQVVYEMFLSRVAEGRGMTTEAVDAVGRGRIWSADSAIERGLVDRRGGFIAALSRARERGRVPSHEEIEYLPARPESLLEYVFDTAGDSSRSRADSDTPARALALPPLAHAALDRAIALSHIQSGTGLAMMPMVVTSH
ncbi:MAG: signal peptide peptidase SppA [Polyangiaceae bacterium]|nr:signal peptide peptidase SppA [Polyangiaceae bacterium]